MGEAADKFLEIYNAIDKHLRKKTGITNRGISFNELVEKASNIEPAVQNFLIDLKEFADLRNAIVHERTDNHVIAEPYQAIVEEFEKIYTLLTKPPKVGEFMTRNPISFKASDSIALALAEMGRKDFSQFPVILNDSTKKLLTANTITRWLGRNVETDIFSLQETPISEVLKYTEDEKHVVFMPRDEDVFRALEIVQDRGKNGERLEAFLITHSGKKTEMILGIITTWDLYKMNQAISF